MGSGRSRGIVQHRWDRVAALCALALLPGLAGCEPAGAAQVVPPAPKSQPAHASKARAPATVTLLYTTDEHGWLLPAHEKGRVRGGAAQMLALWTSREGHCPGPAAGAGAAPAACSDPSTLALSGGDNWTGPAISSYFQGEPMADAMRRMGYAASAFGNHEFDFGRGIFLENRARGGFVYLAANLSVEDPRLRAFEMPSFAIFERRGVRIGVVGIGTDQTLKTAMASRFDGMVFLDEERALARAIPQAWAAEPDALVLLAHECPDKLEPILARHPEWNLSFIGGGHCHRKLDLRVHGVPLVNPGWRMRGYARVRLDVDPGRPLGQRVRSTTSEIVDVEHADGDPPAPPDAPIAGAGAAWQARLDRVLGEEIGYSSDGLDKDSPEIGRWIAHAWRDQLGVDVAILNKDGIRQAVPRGPVTMATIYSVLPFDNKLLVCSLRGSDVLESIRNEEAVVGGLSRSQDGRYVLANGRPLEEGGRYTVATIDFLYFGGDGFQFQAQDPSPKWTGLDWRAPVIEWTKALATSPSAPLETRVR